MRFAALVLGMTLLAAPAFAAMAGQNSPGATPPTAPPHNFGRIVCPQHVPCPPDSGTSNSTYTSNANACITQYFGYSSPSGFFQESYGPDSKGCLTSKADTLPKGMGAQLTPQCCVTTLSDNSCTFRCELNTTP